MRPDAIERAREVRAQSRYEQARSRELRAMVGTQWSRTMELRDCLHLQREWTAPSGDLRAVLVPID